MSKTKNQSNKPTDFGEEAAFSDGELTKDEIIEVRKMLKSTYSQDDFNETHNHDNINSSYIQDLNIAVLGGTAVKLEAEKITFGLGIRLKNSADGLPNLGDGDLGTMFYNTTYDEVWVWRYNGVDGNEWKALDYVA